MKLNKDILNTFLERSNVESGALEIWYGFNNRSGHVLFNDALDDPSGESVYNGCVSTTGYPAVLVGSGSNSFSFEDGSGYFDSESVFKVGGVDFMNRLDGFTVIANIKNFDNVSNRDRGKTLMSTMASANDTSGFSIGINGANRVYFHFADLEGDVNRSIQSEYEINNYSIFSISYKPSIGRSNSYHDYACHDIVNLEESAGTSWSVNRCYGCVNSTPSNTLYIGDFYEQSDGYTGFKGHVGDILIFKGVLPTHTRQEISKAFFAESITPRHSAERTVQENIITGSGIVEMRVTGTGITGYEQIDVYSSITPRGGGAAIEVCKTVNSGVTGALTGSVVTYSTGSGIVTRTYKEIVPESITYASSGYAPYSKRNLLFFNPVESDELYEIYSYPVKSDKINRSTELEFSTPDSQHSDSPVSICEKFAAAMCTDSSWSGKVCYPCNKYSGESSCGDCYKITSPVDGPCESTDTCESGFENAGDCKKFVFEECIRRFDAPIGVFDLRQTIIPSSDTYYSENYEFANDQSFTTSGGNAFVNGVFTKEGVKDCEMVSRHGAESTTNRNIYQRCGVKSGTYMIFDDFKGFYSGTHSFNIRYRYDFYDPTGYRVFNSDDFIYIPPTKEFVVFDDVYDNGIDGETGKVKFVSYVTGSTNLAFDGNEYLNKDLYLNGLKLTSGYNYTGNSTTGIDLIRSTLPAIEDAELSFVLRPNYLYRNTGDDFGNHKNVGFDLLSEQIWVNGLRQAEGVNYIKTPQNSLLNTDIILRSHNSDLYSNTEDFFNQ